jgi:hypothetical protein
MKPFIRRATSLDAVKFASRLRPEDARELQAAHPGRALWDILSNSVEQSESYLLAFDPEWDEPCVLFGVAPIEYGIGALWMVCTDGIAGHAISILREAGHWITYWQAKYSLLVNQVELRNTLHIRWLELLGARIGHHVLLRNGVEITDFSL